MQPCEPKVVFPHAEMRDTALFCTQIPYGNGQIDHAALGPCISHGNFDVKVHAIAPDGQALNHRQGVDAHTDHGVRSEEHTSELQSRGHLVCRLLLEKKKTVIL